MKMNFYARKKYILIVFYCNFIEKVRMLTIFITLLGIFMAKPLHELPYLARNIRYYRKLASLSIANLAEKIGMTEAHFGRIERGLNIPSAAVVAQIAGILNIPIENLFDDIENNKNAAIHFRGADSLSDELKEKVDSIVDIYSSIEDICNASKYRSFPLDIPMKTFSNVDINDAAQMVRELLGIRYAIVFDLFDLFENNGLRTIVLDLPENISGFSYFDTRANSITFFINSKVTDERKKYTLVHELGHLIFHQGSLKHSIPAKSVDPENNTFNLERISNYFAACFLIPEKCLKNSIAQTGITQSDWTYEFLIRIKTKFGVSAESFLNRLDELNFIEESNFKKIKKQIKKFYKETNHKEPGANRINTKYNSRLWDLVMLAENREKKKVITDLTNKLISLGVVR